MEPTGEGKPTRPLREVLEIAKAQRGILVCIGLNILFVAVVVMLAVAAPGMSRETLETLDGVRSLVALVVVICGIVFAYRLAKHLKGWSPILVVIGMFVPCLNLLILLLLSSKATAAIREAGFSVGLIGANVGEIEARVRKYGPDSF